MRRLGISTHRLNRMIRFDDLRSTTCYTDIMRSSNVIALIVVRWCRRESGSSPPSTPPLVRQVCRVVCTDTSLCSTAIYYIEQWEDGYSRHALSYSRDPIRGDGYCVHGCPGRHFYDGVEKIVKQNNKNYYHLFIVVLCCSAFLWGTSVSAI